MQHTVVLKFGGTSVGSAERIQSLPSIVAPYLKQYKSVIVVCSAMSKITDLLIKTGQDAAAKKTDYENGFHEILVKHHAVIKKLFRSKKKLIEPVEKMFDELNRIYRGIYLTG